MKHLPTYLSYIVGWLCITVVYIFCTQLDDAPSFNILDIHKTHQIIQASNTTSPKNSESASVLKKHKHLHPFSKSKVSPNDTNGKIIVLSMQYGDNIVLSTASDIKNTCYSNYLKNRYKCLFFKEINPPPPKNC